MPVHLCGHPIERGSHVCAFVRSREEEYAIRAPFMREGLEQGERLLQIVDRRLRDDHERRLARAGLDVSRAKPDQMVTLAWEEAHLHEGRFDHERMIALVNRALDDARDDGYPLVRGMANMSWALMGAPGTERLLEYEARFNEFCVGRPDVLVCCYEADRFPASTVVDLVRTHPALIIGGVYHENPFYVEPRQMLDELAARRQVATA